MADIKPILDGAQVPQTVKADAWDAFQQASSPQDFQARFDKIGLPKETKAALWDAKFSGGQATGDSSQQGGSWLDNLRSQHPVMAAPLDLLAGIGSGALSTVYHAGDLIRRATGQERIINKPEVQSLITAPPSIAGKVGKFGEQAAEFAAPMGAVSNATKGAHLLIRMGAEGLAAGATGAVQSGGDEGATTGAALTGAAGPLIGAAAGAAANKLGLTPERIYQSALKPTWSMVKKQGLDMLDTGLREKIPVSGEGLAKVEGIIGDLRQQISDGIQKRSMQGATVDTSKILTRLDDLEDFYKNTAAPEDALKTIQDLKLQFEQYHGQKIPLDKAQQIKINTYQEIKKSYGEMASAKVEGLKQVARGIKEEISNVFPEIAGLNERQSKLLGLDEALTRAVWRIENHQMMGIGSPIAASAGHALLGGPGAAVGLVGKFVLDDPAIKSKIAIALANQGVKASQSLVNARLASLKGAMEAAASKLSAGPEPLPMAADAQQEPNAPLAMLQGGK